MTGTFHRSIDHPKLAVLSWNLDPYWDPVNAGATDAAKALGASVTCIKSEPTVEAETRHIREFLDSVVQAIAIAPHSDTATMRSLIDEAAGRAVVITFDSDAPTTRRRGYAGTDDYAAGEMAGDEVRAAVPDGGRCSSRSAASR